LGVFYLFLGVVSSISALPVLARILSGKIHHTLSFNTKHQLQQSNKLWIKLTCFFVWTEFKLFTTPLGVFTLTAASIDDLIAWPLLALTIVLVGLYLTRTKFKINSTFH
jgi:Kef-type K+ transport system membrane component KefB